MPNVCMEICANLSIDAYKLYNLVNTDTNCIYINYLMSVYTYLHLYLMAHLLLTLYFKKIQSIIELFYCKVHKGYEIYLIISQPYNY